MRKVVVYQLLSLDGVAEEPGDWMVDDTSAVVDNLTRVIEPQDAVLLGRGTYEYWSGYWPTADFQPFAGFVNGTPKHVFTSRPFAPDWEGSVVVTEPAAPYVAALKEADGGDIGVHGSIRLAQSLLAADLVDELQLVVSPVLANNGGRRLFEAGGGPRRLTLESSTAGPAGTLFLRYGR